MGSGLSREDILKNGDGQNYGSVSKQAKSYSDFERLAMPGIRK